MLILKNIIIFNIIALIFLSTIFGYGLFFKKVLINKITINTHESGFFGFIIIYLISNLIHFFFPLTNEVSYIFIIIGLIFFIRYFNFNKYLIHKNFLFSLLIFFLVVLTINFHDDRYWYQLPYINYYQNYKTIIGINSLNFFFYGNSIYDIMSIFNIGKFPNSIVYILPSSIIFFISFFILQEIKNKNFNHLLILLIFFSFLILFRYARSKEYGADLFTMSLMFLVIYYSWKENEKSSIDNLFKIFVLFIFSIFSKIYAIFIIFYPIYFLLKNFKQSILLIKNKSFIILIFLLISVSFLKNYLHSSCLIYPIKLTCISNNVWYNGDKVIEGLQVDGEAIAKGFKNYIYKEQDPNLTAKDFLEKYKYKYFKYLILDKDIERIIISFFIFIITYLIFFRSLKMTKNDKYKNLFLLSILSLLFWLLYLPQSRYGGNMIILIFIASFFGYFSKSVKIKYDKISIIFIILSIIFFSTKNIDRINNQIIFSKNNSIDFPFKKFNDFSATEINYDNFNFVISNHIRYCTNSKIICTTDSNFKSIDKIFLKKTYMLIQPNRDKLNLALKKQAYDHKLTYINYK